MLFVQTFCPINEGCTIIQFKPKMMKFFISLLNPALIFWYILKLFTIVNAWCEGGGRGSIFYNPQIREGYPVNPLTPFWPRQNFSLQYQYNTKQSSDENKEIFGTWASVCLMQGFTFHEVCWRHHRVFDHMRSGCEHSSSFKSVNMQNKHGSSIYMIAQLLSEEVYWKQ